MLDCGTSPARSSRPWWCAASFSSAIGPAHIQIELLRRLMATSSLGVRDALAAGKGFADPECPLLLLSCGLVAAGNPVTVH